MKISVIIPAINEAGSIGRALLAIGDGADEVIVADGGSTDGTQGLARSFGARVLETEKGRGRQMDEAAAEATGDVLVFLHADTALPSGWAGPINGAFRDTGVVAGAFRLSIGSGRPVYRLIERAVALRCRLLGLVYGDQAIFVRRDIFFRAGGFNKLPLMEDVDCVKRLRRFGRFTLLGQAVVTSPRRWEREGVSASLKNLAILSLYHAGVSPRRLYGWYYGA